MNIFSLLLFFACFNYLYLGIITYRLDKKSMVNRVMLLLCISYTLWAFSFAFMHAAAGRYDAFAWYRISSVGWNMFVPLTLHLLLLMSHNKRFVNPWTLVIMYAPAVAGIIYANAHVLHPGILRKVPGGWVPVYNISFHPVLVYVSAYVLYLVTGFTALYLWGRRARFRREKKQMRIIIATSVVALAFGSFIDVMLPAMNIAVIPVMAPVMGMIWLVGLWFAVKKYRLMVLSTSFAASEIIKSMRDLMVLADYDGIISHVSPRTCAALGYGRADLIRKPIGFLVVESDQIDDEMRHFRFLPRDSSISDVHFRTGDGSTIPVRLSCSSIRDAEGDLLGFVFVGYDMRETKKLIEMQRMVDIDMEMAARVQSGIFPSPPSGIEGWSVSMVFRPVFPVSGDFYDFYVSERRLRGVSLFDVSGHGVAAGLITMIAKSIVYRIFTSHTDAPLNHVARLINDELVRDIGHIDNFITGILLRIGDGAVEYVNAGHTHLLLKRGDGGAVSIVNLPDRDFRGAFLGVPEMVSRFDVMTFKVAPGDMLLLYTDALIEAADAGKEHYGLGRLIASFETAPVGSAAEAARHIMGDLERWTGGKRIEDDLTMMLMLRSS
ncbi:MAG: SpoIIE family protein phosphatase [Spirochaetes bacterium]|nr:SpoIIE family protein phosphatase [Spirochaetota bacterium]